jgi:hypothetical protein
LASALNSSGNATFAKEMVPAWIQASEPKVGETHHNIRLNVEFDYDTPRSPMVYTL